MKTLNNTIKKLTFVAVSYFILASPMAEKLMQSALAKKPVKEKTYSKNLDTTAQRANAALQKYDTTWVNSDIRPKPNQFTDTVHMEKNVSSALEKCLKSHLNGGNKPHLPKNAIIRKFSIDDTLHINETLRKDTISVIILKPK